MIIVLEFHQQKIVEALKQDVQFIKALEPYELWEPKPGHIDNTIIIASKNNDQAYPIFLKNISSIILINIKNLFEHLNSIKINEDLDAVLIIDKEIPMVSVKSIYFQK